MSNDDTIRNAVMKSLMALGPVRDTAFYSALFQEHAPEKFALIIIDPRCLKNPLLDAFLSSIKILADLNLTPILLVGAVGGEHIDAQFQSGRLFRELEAIGVISGKLDCASYQLLNSVRRLVQTRRIPVLQMTEAAGGFDLPQLIGELAPAKVIFLQPSGAIRIKGQRIAVVNIDEVDREIDRSLLSLGQNRFIDMVKELASQTDYRCTYVIASPLNLLGELFTIKGSGTMLRRGAKILSRTSLKNISNFKLKASMESAFDGTLVSDYLDRPFTFLVLEENYRAGAIMTQLAGLSYLSKFWVAKEAQGEGVAHDVWQKIIEKKTAFFWRSRKTNPFNDWYMKMCDGMQISGDWRVFWKGLDAPEIPAAILAAANTPIDFEELDFEELDFEEQED